MAPPTGRPAPLLDVRQYSLSQAVIDGRTPFRPLGRPHAFLTTVGGVGPAEFESGSGAHNFNLQLSAPLLVAVRGDRRASTSLVAPGQVSLNVAGEQFRCVVWPRPGNQALHVALPPRWVAEVAEREGVTGGSPRPMLGRWEPRLRTLALRLVDGLRRGVSADRLWGDEWYQRLAVELLRAGRTGQPSAPPAGRLTVPVVRRVVDYLEAHLGAQVSLAELAQFGGLSQYHFARAFRATLGVSPHRYLTELRLQRARHLIATSRLPLSDIALAVGFASLSHFSTAFRGHVGCSPSQFRAATG